MKLLALDTSSVACSAALQLGETIVERHEERPREHTRILLPMVRELLAEGGISLGELDGIVLGNGPGSFIGMRIAAAVAQGLAFGAGLKVLPVSSLAAVAAEVFATGDAGEVLVAQDARMGEVYLGAFGRGDGAVPAPLFDERLHDQGPIEEADAATAAQRVAAGFGWQRYPDLLAVNEQRFAGLSEVWHPRARYLLDLVTDADIAGQGVDPKEIVPAYLRQKVAEKPANRS
jgi:tRNA threonylcarbamoyladenosine biosynthesis protein TsaB